MTERPILFQSAMVRALLAGTKTQTRRIFLPERMTWTDDGRYQTHALRDGELVETGSGPFVPAGWLHYCPYGQPGDRLIVRETWQYADWTEDGYPFIRYRADDAKVLHERIPSDEWGEKLQDIWAGLSAPENFAIDNTAADRRWRPAIHMPRWASRITLEITGVRVERLQAISEADAVAEGLTFSAQARKSESCMGIYELRLPDGLVHFDASAVNLYRKLWEQLNGPGSWDANPYVWCVSFRRTA